MIGVEGGGRAWPGRVEVGDRSYAAGARLGAGSDWAAFGLGIMPPRMWHREPRVWTCCPPLPSASNDLELLPQPLDCFIQWRVRLAVEDIIVLVGDGCPGMPEVQGIQREESAVAAKFGGASLPKILQLLVWQFRLPLLSCLLVVNFGLLSSLFRYRRSRELKTVSRVVPFSTTNLLTHSGPPARFVRAKTGS